MCSVGLTHATDIRGVCTVLGYTCYRYRGMCSVGLHMLQILGEYMQCWATHATDIRGVCAVLGYTCYKY